MSRLAGGIAHELGNLLTSILGYAELLNERLPSGSEEQADAERIIRAALRGRTITSQLSALGRERSWEPRPVSLNDVVRALAARLGDGPSSVPPHVRLDAASGLVEVDPAALEKVLLGLALSAGESSGERVPIEIRTQPLDLTRPRPGRPRPVPVGSWETVSFGPFTRAGSTSTTPGPGLAVADALVTRAGGIVATEPGGFPDRVTVFLPRAASATVHPMEGVRHHDGAVILLVEDQEPVREVIARRLEQEGYRVHQAGHGRAALAVLDELEQQPDLVLTDIVMPEMTGRELARELGLRAPHLPVLFMSGYAGAEMPRGDGLPIIRDEDLLTKPFSSQELLDHVARRLEKVPGS